MPRGLERLSLYALPFLRRDGPDGSRELRMGYRINRPISDRGTRRVRAEKVVAFPILRRPDWPRNKAAAAIWTDVIQNAIHTCGTERTLIGADARLE